MTNFVDYAFRSANIPVMCPGLGPCEHTLPSRLADIKNVKDFGATGNGVTDDWAAIMAAYNWTVANVQRGVVFFPPGDYRVSQPIDFGNLLSAAVCFLGVFGASTITGNFDDFVLKRARVDGNSDSGPFTVENLTVVNTHATGGGIRLGSVVGGAIRNCVVTANKGINTADDFSPALSSFEISIENCTLRPGVHTSGSLGIFSVADGPILNCSMVGFDTGLSTTGQQGCINVLGCRFELCGVGVDSGTGSLVSGCLFKDCGTAINGVGGSCRYSGIRIEGTEGTISGDPQYGIKLSPNGSQRTVLEGIIVTGQFEHYGIDCGSGETFLQYLTFIGVKSINTSTKGGLPWRLSPNPATAQFINCNVAPVFTMAGLPTPIGNIISAAWVADVIWTVALTSGGSGYVDGNYFDVPLTGGSGSGAVAALLRVNGGAIDQVTFYPRADDGTGGTNYALNDVLSASNANLGGSGSGFSLTVATVFDTASVTTDIGQLGGRYATAGVTLNLNIQGVSRAGYNGLFTDAVAVANTVVSYAVSDPGGTGSGGTIKINPVNSGVPAAQEGDCYNVSDANSATWGANPVGGGSTHAKVRWGDDGTDWTLVGK